MQDVIGIKDFLNRQLSLETRHSSHSFAAPTLPLLILSLTPLVSFGIRVGGGGGLVNILMRRLQRGRGRRLKGLLLGKLQERRRGWLRLKRKRG